MRSVQLALVSLLLGLGQGQARADDLPLAPALPPPSVDGQPGRPPPSPDDDQDRPRHRAAQRTYDLQRLGFDSQVSTDDDGVSSVAGQQPYQGKYHRPLETDAFLDLVGRSDLARSYRVRSGVRTVLLIGAVGGTLVAGGEGLRMLITGNEASSCDSSSPQFSSCMEAADKAEAIRIRDGVLLVTATSVVGPLLITGLALWDPNPVPEWQMRQLADEYNARLRAKLGLPEDEQDLGTLLLHSARVQPFVSPWGGGLALQGSF